MVKFTVEPVRSTRPAWPPRYQPPDAALETLCAVVVALPEPWRRGFGVALLEALRALQVDPAFVRTYRMDLLCASTPEQAGWQPQWPPPP